MTLNQLLSETYALGFEDDAKLDLSFVFAANRAIRILIGEHAEEKVARIFIPPAERTFHIDMKEYEGGEDAPFFDVRGNAFSCFVSGRGSILISDAEGTQKKSFSSMFSGVKAILRGSRAKITFLSDEKFTVYNLSVFSSSYFSAESEIPYYCCARNYNLAGLIDGYGFATSAPEDKNSSPIKSAKISGSILELPWDISGEIKIRYKEIPKALTLDDGELELPIPKICEHLCPILTAAYVWLDDEEEKAAYYMQLYKDESQRLRMSYPKRIDQNYTDTAGWAT